MYQIARVRSQISTESSTPVGDLPEPAADYLEDDFLINLVATGVDFQTDTTVVERAIAHFRQLVRPALRGLDDLEELLRVAHLPSSSSR